MRKHRRSYEIYLEEQRNEINGALGWEWIGIVILGYKFYSQRMALLNVSPNSSTISWMGYFLNYGSLPCCVVYIHKQSIYKALSPFTKL